MKTNKNRSQLIFSSTQNFRISLLPLILIFIVFIVIFFSIYFYLPWFPTIIFWSMFLGFIISFIWVSFSFSKASRKTIFFNDYADFYYIILSGIPSLERVSYDDIEWYNIHGRVIEIKSPKVNVGDVNEIGFYTKEELKEIEKIFISKNIMKKSFNKN